MFLSLDETGSYPSKVVDKGRQWLHCVSQRSGLPFWLLTSMLFMSIFFLLWLCCATTTTAPKERIKVKAVLKQLTSSCRLEKDTVLLCISVTTLTLMKRASHKGQSLQGMVQTYM